MQKEYSDRLAALKERSGMTNQQIAEGSKVPASTVSKIISNSTESPSFDAVCAMVKAMGGSVDEIIGIATEAASPVEIACEQLQRVFGKHSHYRDIQEEQLRRDKRALAVAVAVMFLAFIGLFAVDLFIGTRGWIRY